MKSNFDEMVKNYSKQMMQLNNSKISKKPANIEKENTKEVIAEKKQVEYKEEIKNNNSTMTNSLGRKITDNNNSVVAFENGPVLLQDVNLIDKIAHFDRERIPERVVHAKGAGGLGYFETYQSMEKYTKAKFLSKEGKKTKVFVRFSTVIGGRGSADTARDPRGFAVKFYTEDGIYDIVGNHLPVFFIKDAVKFPDVIHSLKPDPKNNLRDPERFWDFISLTPEATHMITWVYSDLGTIKDYACIDGFGVNTYIWVNKDNQKHYVKFHWKTQQGVETITRKEAEYLAGNDPDISTRNLYNRLSNGNVKYELCVQLLKPEEIPNLDFDPLDDTKTWDEKLFPLMKVGMLTLTDNPENFFETVEQAAFCPANIVAGIELSADKMLQGRSFSYHDTQRYRLGANFAQLEVNSAVNKVDNNQRDGEMTYKQNPQRINYSPNSLNGNMPSTPTNAQAQEDFLKLASYKAKIREDDNFYQAGERYRSLSEIEKNNLCDNIAVELSLCNKEIQERVLENFYKACPNFAEKVREYIHKEKNR